MKHLYESLHSHTVISDGYQTHVEVLETAEGFGFGLIAFTDHDILPRQKDLKALKSYSGPVKWEIGVEMSSGWPAELGGGPANMFHILAIRIDSQNQAIKDYCRQAQEARVERMRKTVENLRSAGFFISFDECLKAAGEGAAATPHVVSTLLDDQRNIKLLEKIACQMKASAEHDETISQRYEDMMYRFEEEKSYRAYAYGLLLGGEAYVPDIQVPYLFSLNMDECVELVRGAGGVAILAHWPTVKHKIDLAKLKEMLNDGKLDGVETRSGFTADKNIEKNAESLEKLADETGKLATIGLDSHVKEDFVKFVEISGLPEQTIGQWQKVLEHGKNR